MESVRLNAKENVLKPYTLVGKVSSNGDGDLCFWNQYTCVPNWTIK